MIKTSKLPPNEHGLKMFQKREYKESKTGRTIFQCLKIEMSWLFSNSFFQVKGSKTKGFADSTSHGNIVIPRFYQDT
jgi:hypothetical protein